MPLKNLYYPGSRPLPIRSLIAQEGSVTVRLDSAHSEGYSKKIQIISINIELGIG